MLERLIEMVAGWINPPVPSIAVFKGGSPPPPPPPPPPPKEGVFEEGLYDEENQKRAGKRKGSYGALTIPRPAQGAGAYGGGN